MARHALLLDLDGTLVDSVPDLMTSLNNLMQIRQLRGFDAAEVTAMVGDGAPALVRKAMTARGREAVAGDIDAFLADYMLHAAVQTRPYPKVADTLDELLAQGWRLGVCTNKPEAAARSLLASLGLLDRFVAVAGGDTFPVRKPHPQHLLGLLQAMRMRADDAVMVGDHHNDIRAAQDAGVPSIFAAWGYGSLNAAEGADAIAAGFAELPGLLARLA